MEMRDFERQNELCHVMEKRRGHLAESLAVEQEQALGSPAISNGLVHCRSVRE
jgi:hypothetical protein